MPDEHPIVERVRIECTDCGGLIDADMAIRHDDKPYCGECHDHPIVEPVPRPDWLWEMPRSMLPGTPEARRKIMDYIEWQEKERERLEAAIRQKDNAFEVCEARRWEAEERVGELDDEIERLKPLAARAPMWTRDEDEDFS